MSSTTALLFAMATLLGSAGAATAALPDAAASQQGLASGTGSAGADAATGPALKLLPQPPPEDAAGQAGNPHHQAVVAWADRQALWRPSRWWGRIALHCGKATIIPGAADADPV